MPFQLGAPARLHRLVRGVIEVAAGIWFLSWFALYLEIFRWHHVAFPYLATAVWPTANSPNQPGGFVRVVVVCSITAPFVWLALAALRQMQPGPSGRRVPHWIFPRPAALVVVGGTLAVLGAMNQVIQHDPLDFDFTLERGNGGFIVIGVMLAAAGGLISRYTDRRSSAVD